MITYNADLQINSLHAEVCFFSHVSLAGHAKLKPFCPYLIMCSPPKASLLYVEMMHGITINGASVAKCHAKGSCTVQHPEIVPLSRSLLLPVNAVIFTSALALPSTLYEKLSTIIKQDCMAHPAFKKMTLQI